MRVEITKRYFFDDSERRKWRYFCLRHHLTTYVLAKENNMSNQYIYSIISGKVAITKRIREMFAKVGYEITKEDEDETNQE